MHSYIRTLTIMICLCSAIGHADTFKHKENGEVFTGFSTQKISRGKTLVYNSEKSKMTQLVLSDYEVTADTKGRRDTVSLLPIDQPEMLLSETVSKKIAAAIIDTSNKGPQAIILQIDSPGGRGSSMKAIAEAVSQTKNCPIIAYISEGAYSAAAVIALACDKIYIKSTAGIGTVGTPGGESIGSESYAEYLSVYNSDALLAYSIYIAALAQQQGRPELLAKALVDKRISIIEVVNIDGSRAFIAKDDRQATQTLIRTLCEGVSATDYDSISHADVVGKVLNLTAKDAVEVGLADGYAESPAHILAEMDLDNTKLSPVPGIEKIMKKYTAARRKISEGIFRIEQYERDIETLSHQFSTIDEQLRTGTQTREVRQGDGGYRSSRQRREYSPDFADQNSDGDVAVRRSRSNSRRNGSPRSQTVITEEPRVDIQTVYNQLTAALRDVIVEYKRVIKLVERWPGGLPPKVSRTMLEADMKSASAELDTLNRYQPVYPTQNQNQYQNQQQRPSRSRNRQVY